MAEIDESGLKELIKKNPVGAYLIYGEEEYLVKVYTERLVNASVDESFRDFNFHVFEGENVEIPEIYESASAVPMMAESKCVLVKNYPFGTAGDGEMKALEELLKDNPEDNCLIFSYPAGAPKATDIKHASSLFSKYGYVVKFDKKTKGELRKILESGALKREKSFEKGVADYLISCVGDDLNLLGNELEKVCAYAGESIKYSDVDAVCIKSLDARVFDMVKDLVAGHFDAAFRKLSQLFARREDEYMILGALIAQYTDMYRACAAVSAGRRAAEVSSYYPSYKGKDFRLNNAARNASDMSLPQIGKCIEILAKADTALKSTRADKKQVLEQTLVSLARAGR